MQSIRAALVAGLIGPLSAASAFAQESAIRFELAPRNVRVAAAAFLPGSPPMVAVTETSGVVRIWSLSDDGQFRTPIRTFMAPGFGLAVSQDGNVIGRWGAVGGVHLWSKEGRLVGTIAVDRMTQLIAVALSPSGDRVALATRPHGVHAPTIGVWSRSGERQAIAFEGEIGAVTKLAFSPDGKLLAACEREGTVRLWRMDGRIAAPPITEFSGSIVSLAFAPSSLLLAALDEEGTLKLWTVAGRQVGRTMFAGLGMLSHIAFSPAGEHIVAGAGDGQIRTWTLAGEPHGPPIRAQEAAITSLSFSPDGRWIATSAFAARHMPTDVPQYYPKRVRIVGLDGRVLGELADGSSAPTTALAPPPGFQSWTFAPESGLIAALEEGRSIRLWELDGRARASIALPGMAGARTIRAAFAPSGETLALGDQNGELRLIARDGRSLAGPVKAHEKTLSAVAFSPKGDVIYTASWDGTWRRWSADAKPIGDPIRAYHDQIVALAVSTDGALVATLSAQGVVELWNADGTRRLQPFVWNERNPRATGLPRLGSKRQAVALAFSPDGKVLAVGGQQGKVHLWSTDDGGHIAEIAAHGWTVTTVAFSPQGELIATGGEDRKLRLWQADGTAAGPPIDPKVGRLAIIRFSEDGQTIIVAGNDLAAVRYLSRAGEIKGPTFPNHGAQITSMSLGPRGDLAIAGADGTVRIWSADGKLLGQPVLAPGAGPTRLVLFPDGKDIVTGNNVGSLQLWSLERGAGRVIIDPAVRLGWPVVAPNGKYFASVAGDRSIRLWTRDGQPAATIPPVLRSSPAALAFSADASRIAAIDGGGFIGLWREDGTPVGLFVPGAGLYLPSVSLALSPAGDALIVGRPDGSIDFYRAGDSLRPVKTVRHGSGTVAIAFERDGKTIVSGGSDGIVRAWRLEQDDVVAVPGEENVGEPIAALGSTAEGVWVRTLDGRLRVGPKYSDLPATVTVREDGILAVANGRACGTGPSFEATTVIDGIKAVPLGSPEGARYIDCAVVRRALGSR